MGTDGFSVPKWSAYKGDFCGHHRIIVVYETVEFVQYFIVTSQVDKARIRSRFDPNSLALINQAEWSQLSRPSCVECSKRNLKQESKEAMKKRREAWGLTPIGDVPEAVRRRIADAIAASVTYTEQEKRLYTL